MKAEGTTEQPILIQESGTTSVAPKPRHPRPERERLVELGEAHAFLVHELRKPLVTIGLLARAMRKRAKLQRQDRAAIDSIIERVSHSEAMLRDCLDFVGPTDGKTEPVDIAKLLAGLRRTLLPQARHGGIELVIDADRHGSFAGPCVRKKLRQAFSNIAHNALEAMSMGAGRLVMRCRTTAKRVVVEFEDTGTGMPPDEVRRAFEPFFTTKRDGTGLGLALAKKIVRDHDGRVSVASEMGTGTTVVVRLPRCDKLGSRR